MRGVAVRVSVFESLLFEPLDLVPLLRYATYVPVVQYPFAWLETTCSEEAIPRFRNDLLMTGSCTFLPRSRKGGSFNFNPQGCEFYAVPYS